MKIPKNQIQDNQYKLNQYKSDQAADQDNIICIPARPIVPWPMRHCFKVNSRRVYNECMQSKFNNDQPSDDITNRQGSYNIIDADDSYRIKRKYCIAKAQGKTSTTSPHFSNSRATQGVSRYPTSVQIAFTPANESGYEIVGNSDRNAKIVGGPLVGGLLLLGAVGGIALCTKKHYDTKRRHDVAGTDAAAQNVELKPLNQRSEEV
ncbi:MAG: hypothetical protein C5B47_00530 [Verrucomicrobia bacterium]|nr:MAG: hypothetical protein C5B47_00530 [Verrucomicrobiota bacterium]